MIAYLGRIFRLNVNIGRLRFQMKIVILSMHKIFNTINNIQFGEEIAFVANPRDQLMCFCFVHLHQVSDKQAFSQPAVSIVELRFAINAII